MFILTGFLNNLIFLSGLRTLTLRFEGSTRQLVLSIFMTSGAAAAVPYPYLLRYLCDTYGLSWTFLIVGALMVIATVLAVTWVLKPAKEIKETENTLEVSIEYDVSESEPSVIKQYSDNIDLSDSPNGIETQNRHTGFRKSDTNSKPYEKKSWKKILIGLIKNRPYIFFAIGQALAHQSLMVLSVFVTDILKDRGLGSYEATGALMAFNFGSLPGLLLPGIVDKIPRTNSLVAVITTTLVATPAVIALNFVSTTALAICACAICGLAFGALYSSTVVCVVQLVCIEHYTAAVGMILGLTGILLSITGPLGGEFNLLFLSIRFIFYCPKIQSLVFQCLSICLFNSRLSRHRRLKFYFDLNIIRFTVVYIAIT